MTAVFLVMIVINVVLITLTITCETGIPGVMVNRCTSDQILIILKRIAKQCRYFQASFLFISIVFAVVFKVYWQVFTINQLLVIYN